AGLGERLLQLGDRFLLLSAIHVALHITQGGPSALRVRSPIGRGFRAEDFGRPHVTSHARAAKTLPRLGRKLSPRRPRAPAVSDGTPAGGPAGEGAHLASRRRKSIAGAQCATGALPAVAG